MSVFKPSALALQAGAGHYAVLASRFNHHIVERLVAGCDAELRRLGVAHDRIETRWVPGAFELPLVAKTLAETGRYAAIVCLGCVIRGDTDHYVHVCEAAARGILEAGLATGGPIIFGVLTRAPQGPAVERCGGRHGNSGIDAAQAAVEMAALLANLNG